MAIFDAALALGDAKAWRVSNVALTRPRLNVRVHWGVQCQSAAICALT